MSFYTNRGQAAVVFVLGAKRVEPSEEGERE